MTQRRKRPLAYHMLRCAIATLRLAALLCAPLPLGAQSVIEAGGFYHHVTNDFGNWKGGYARAVIAGARNVWYLDARAQDAFGDRGVYGSLANVHTFSSRIYTQVGIGGGTGDFVLPDLRIDASLGVKLGSARAVILTAGGTLVDAKSEFRDRSLFGSLTWYASGTLLLEGGTRVNWSSPGSVVSARGFGSVSMGRPGKMMLTARGSAGSEGYQLTGAEQTLRKFNSQEADLRLRVPLGGSLGVVLGGDWYHNPFYTRAGALLGLFHAW